MGANTLKKLERHNVNIHDMNNETLRQECLGQLKSTVEITTQPTEILKDQATVKVAITDKSNDGTIETQEPVTPSTKARTRHQYQDEKVTKKGPQLQNDDDKGVYVNETENGEKQNNENLPTLEKVINFWNKFNNNTKVIGNRLLTDVTITPPNTAEIVTISNNGKFHPNAIEYLKNMLGYIASENIAQNNTKRQDTGKFEHQKKDMKNNGKLQRSSGIESIVKNQIVSSTPYQIGDQTTSYSATLEKSQQRTLNNADVIDLNNNFLIKEGAADIGPPKIFVNQNKLYEQPKHEPVLVNEPNQRGVNIVNLMKTITSPLHTNKRELNDFHESNSPIKTIIGAAASEFYPRISDIGQSPRNDERDMNDVLHFLDKTRKINNNFIKQSKSAQTIPNLEDWYSNFIRNNMKTPPSVAARNNQNELAKESLFDTTYTLTNDNKQADKYKEIQYLGYNPMRGESKAPKILPPVPYVEPDYEAFDINALLYNNFRATARSNDMPYPDFDPKGINTDFLATSPIRDNNEENVSAFNPNQFTNNNKKAIVPTSYFRHNPKLEDFNLNLLKSKLCKNEGDTVRISPSEKNDYEHLQGVIDAPYIGSKPTPDNFISRFRKQNIARLLNKESYQNHNDDYNETSKETTLPDHVEPYIPLANTGKPVKIIPPFLENIVKPNSNDNGFKNPNSLGTGNIDESRTILASEDDPTTNNTNRIIEKVQDVQYNQKVEPSTLIQGDQVRLIKNSLQYINHILEMHDGNNGSSISTVENTTNENIQNKTTQSNVIKKRINKNATKRMLESNNSSNDSITHPKDVPVDLIKAIAESVKNIILRDIKKGITTETPGNTTTTLATTTTTEITTTINNTEVTAASTKVQEATKAIDADYIVQKILELFKELKTGRGGTIMTTSIPTKLFEAHVTKYVYASSKNDQPPPMPAFNPYGVKPEIIHTNYTNGYNQMYRNVNNSNKDPLQPQMLNQTSQMMNIPPRILNQLGQMPNQSPQILNHKLQMFNQPPQYYNQPILMPPQQIILNHLPQNLNPQPSQLMNQASQMNPIQFQINRPPQQVTNQSPQTIYHYPLTLNQPPQISFEPVQMNTAPLLTYQALQDIYHFPQVLNRDSQMLGPPSQMMNQAPQIVTLQTVNRSPQMLNQPRQMMGHPQQILNQQQQMRNQDMFNQPSQMFNQAPQMMKGTRQIVNRLPQMWNQPMKNVNHAQQILNKALQMKTRASQIANESPEVSNQSPQIENHPQEVFNQGLQMRNQAIQMMNSYPGVLNPPQQNPNHPPYMLNRAPQMTHQAPGAKFSAPLINYPLKNAFQSPPYLTFQTNLNEIPPLGIPVENPKRFINQVIILTTQGPFGKPNYAASQMGPKNMANEQRKIRAHKESRSDLTNKMRVTDNLKHHDPVESSRNKSVKQRVNEYYTNYSGNQRELYRQGYNKKSVYDRARPRHETAQKFHEQLERIEDWSKMDRKRSRERVQDCSDHVPSRQQVSMTKLKQRSKYDDTHFKNFLKTQEKVNNMLEAILATKKTGRPRSVELP